MKGSALFIYWHVLPADATAAEQAAKAFQAQLRLQASQVLAALYRRNDEARQRITLMETYCTEHGLSPEQASALVSQSAQALQAWAMADRHVEFFSAVV